MGGLSRWFCLRNSRAARKRVIAERRLPVTGDDQLRAIQELNFIQEGSGEIGAIEHRLKKVCAFQAGTRQVRPAQVRSPEIGIPKIHAGEVKSAQIERSQTGSR